MAAALTGPAYNAKFDANRTPSLTAVSGTAGTSDTTGTAEVIRLSANPATGAQYVEDVSSDAGTNVNIVTGTITRVSNIGTLEVGTVSEKLATGFNGGTISVGTAAVELTFTGTPRGIMISADHGNGTMVYIGDSNVSQVGSAAIARLDPGESLSIEEFDDTSAALYAVAGTTAQKVYKVAFT